MAAFLPGPNMAVYYATKAYVVSFSEALHWELRPRGIRVTALCPGPVPTEFQARAGFTDDPNPDMLTQSADRVARGRLSRLAARPARGRCRDSPNRDHDHVTRLRAARAADGGGRPLQRQALPRER